MSHRGGQGFDRSLRLLAAADFRRVFARGTRHRGQEFTIISRVNGLDSPRLGLAISRRSAPRAVDRNRLKRIVRESFRRRSETMSNVDIVVQATPAARERSNAVLRRSLDDVWATFVPRENGNSKPLHE